MSKTFTPAEVAKHKDEKEGMYIIVDTGVYDITSKVSSFLDVAWRSGQSTRLLRLSANV